MKLTIAAVGRLKAGPQRTLLETYAARADKAGRQVGLTLDIRELPESRASELARRTSDEASRLLALLPSAARLVALDETGRNLSSMDFAARIGRWRDDGTAETVLAIGGPDGHGAALIARADLTLAFGAATWPHQFVRIMLAEQVYRAITILSGHPYHHG
ncbi:MAG: 23S rRNA (pseudouridine(1915)-N(3))-methyltransferase RlmH [Alphaproteobacteria bacterium]